MKTTTYKLITRDYLIKCFKSDFVLNQNDISLKKELNKHQYSLNKDRHSSKNIIMWEQYGLIVDNRKQGEGWKKYSFSECVWIDLIKKLKCFGFHRKTLLPIKAMLAEIDDQAKISKLPLLDFYIKLILTEHKQIFLIADDLGHAILISQDHLSSVEQLIGYVCEDMVKLNLSKMVLELAQEFSLEINSIFRSQV